MNFRRRCFLYGTSMVAYVKDRSTEFERYKKRSREFVCDRDRHRQLETDRRRELQRQRYRELEGDRHCELLREPETP
jgi:hypothetical protein